MNPEQHVVMEDQEFSRARSGGSSSGKTWSTDLQLADCAPETLHKDLEFLVNSYVKTTRGTPAVQIDHNAYVPVNDISPEAYAFLAAAEAAAVFRADAMDAGNVKTIHTSFSDLHDPERILLSMAPPKKFYRTFWQSVSLRLLHRWTQTAKPSISDAPARQAPVD
jgi:hypothetical protein